MVTAELLHAGPGPCLPEQLVCDMEGGSWHTWHAYRGWLSFCTSLLCDLSVAFPLPPSVDPEKTAIPCFGKVAPKYPATTHMWRSCLSACIAVYLSVCLSVCMSICLSVCLYACLSLCLSVCLLVCLSICLSVWLYLRTSGILLVLIRILRCVNLLWCRVWVWLHLGFHGDGWYYRQIQTKALVCICNFLVQSSDRQLLAQSYSYNIPFSVIVQLHLTIYSIFL